MENILLVEPDYNNKYPPIGLMKIATYHKNKGDYVEFYKGKAPFTQISRMDRVYITSLFTFHFDITVDTVNHYLKYKSVDNVYFGGIAATLLPERFKESTGIRNLNGGQLTDSSIIGYDDHVNIDELPLDYDILDDISYQYPAGDNFFIYATRGCPRKCGFCAVKTLEPQFRDTNKILCQIKYIRSRFGDKRNVLLMDNNVLYSNELKKIATDLETLDFVKDEPNFIPPNDFDIMINKIRRRLDTRNTVASVNERLIVFLEEFKRRIKKSEILVQYNKAFEDLKNNSISLDVINEHEKFFHDVVDKYRFKKPLQRYVDFNQGIDARLLDDEKMKLISNLPIRPFRLAFDNIGDTKTYKDAFAIAYNHGIRHFSNYMLYNYEDTPKDLWNRLYTSIMLYKNTPGVKAFSFPMKYAPIDMIDRSYIGIGWNKKFLSAMNVILNVTKGVVAQEDDFFYKAYGKTPEEFKEILTMPNEFIKHRLFFEGKGFIDAWKAEYSKLCDDLRNLLINFLCDATIFPSPPTDLQSIIKYYSLTKYQVETGKVKLENLC